MSKSPVQQEIDKLDNDERNEIKIRIAALGVSLNRIVMESQITSLPKYLKGGKMHTGTMFIVKRTLTRLEGEKSFDAI